jgi:tetratricopeptide (TPR) repeat protein
MFEVRKNYICLMVLILFVSSDLDLRADQAIDDYPSGLALYKQGSFQASSVVLEKIVLSNPNFWQAFQVLGYDYAKLGNYQKALDDCSKSFSLHSENPDLQIYIDKLKTLLPSNPSPTVEANTSSPTKVTIPAPTSTQVGETTAARTKSNLPSSFFYYEFTGGADFPARNWQSAYSLGPGGKISFGYEFNKNWDFQLDIESFYFSGMNYSGAISDLEFLVLPTIRYSFNINKIRPYLLAGVGEEFEFLSGDPVGASVSDLDIALGLGLEAALGNRIFLFLEGKYNFIFSSKVVGQDIPVLAGVRFGI